MLDERDRRRRRRWGAGMLAAVAATAVMIMPGVAQAEPSLGGGAAPLSVEQDETARTVTMAGGGLRMVLGYAGKAQVTSLKQGGTELLDAGMWSAAKPDGSASPLDSRWLTTDPSVSVRGKAVTAAFVMADDHLSVSETWRFTVTRTGIDLNVDRTYDWQDGSSPVLVHNGQLDIGWARVWDNIRRPGDGGNLPIGNAYTGRNSFFLSQPKDRYGVEQADFTLLSNEQRSALHVQAVSNRSLATEFAYTGDGNTYQETQASAAGWQYTAGTKEEGYVYGGHSSNDTDAYIYAPVTVAQGQQDRVQYRFAPTDYAQYYSLGGTIKGVTDQPALSSLLNDFGRSGVIDKDYGMSTVGLRYPGVGPYDMVYADQTVLGFADPAITASHTRLLEYFRDYGQLSNGHMKGRTFHRDYAWRDNSLFDADPAYALSVAAMYQADPDADWVASMRGSVEKALGYMLSTQYDGSTGLFHNDATTCTSTRGSREWNDAFFVRYASGYVNELMYAALTQWADLEKSVFHDPQTAGEYSAAAAQLKEQFNKSTSQGGFWDESTGMFAYWLCPDGTAQGTVEHTQINLQAIYYGMADLPRARAILDKIDAEMQRNRLPMIPQNFWPIPNTQEWSGDHFQTGLEDGAIYPFMTEEYMRAAAVVGERSRSLTYLNNTLDRYTKDGFNGFSYVTWAMKGKPQEAWFPSNANGAGGLFTDVLGIRPTADGVTVAPNIPAAMNGTTVTRTVRGSDKITVTYHDELRQTVTYQNPQEQVTMQWSGQQPSAAYTIADGKHTRQVVADSLGSVRYTFRGNGKHTVRLVRGDADGHVLPAGPRPDLALGATVTASSSQEDADWGTSRAVDGDRFSADGTHGWSSISDPTENHTEWLEVDLGAVRTVHEIQLLPRDYDAKNIGQGFPVDFRVEVSTDGGTWTTVSSQTAYPQPRDKDVPTFDIGSSSARYVRVVGTNLRTAEGGEYRMQLAEIEVS